MNLGLEKIKEIIQKIGFFRLSLLVIAGVILLVFSFPEDGDSSQVVTEDRKVYNDADLLLDAMEKYEAKKENEIEELLEKVDGIGKVKVMLTLSSSEERVPMQNGQSKEEEVKESDKEGGTRDTNQFESQKENILISKDGEEEPYVVQVYSPLVEGVAVVAEGAGSGEKKKEIIETIQALFHIEPHKIKVMKME